MGTSYRCQSCGHGSYAHGHGFAGHLRHLADRLYYGGLAGHRGRAAGVGGCCHCACGVVVVHVS